MTKATVMPGPCGHITTLYAKTEDKMMAEISVETDCPSIQKFIEALGEELNAYEVCMSRTGKSKLYDLAEGHLPAHVTCPVPVALLKCIEAECGLALPRDVSITIEKIKE